MKFKRLGFLSVILMLSGCAVHSSTYSSSSGYISNGVGHIQYSYGNGYWYDNNYDYYDGLYGEFIGGVFYVVRLDGRRFSAPKPRHPHHRFTEKGWPGYNHINTSPWIFNNRNNPPHGYPPYSPRPGDNGYHKPLPPKYPYSPRPGDNGYHKPLPPKYPYNPIPGDNGYHKPLPPKYPYNPRPNEPKPNNPFKNNVEPRNPQHWNYDKEFRN